VNAALAGIDEAIANEEIGKGKSATPARAGQAAPPAAVPAAAAGGSNPNADAGAGAAAGADATAKLEPFKHFCERVPYSDSVQAQTCAAREARADDRDRVKRRLRQWTSWPFSPSSTEGATATTGTPKTGTGAKPAVGSEDYQIQDAPAQAALRANIIGSAVLPFLYGLLGAAAAVIRSISKKIRASLLSPRDLTLSLQQLALGAVTGACIGLFIASPGSSPKGELFADPVGLSGPAISFIAGFGVDAVFQALEELIKRIFNVNPVAAGAPAPAPVRNVVVRRRPGPPPPPPPPPPPTPPPPPAAEEPIAPGAERPET